MPPIPEHDASPLAQRLRVCRRPAGPPEIFFSIQGEGASIGAPSVFLRLASCNLACVWCDTKYAWDWTNYDRDQHTIEMRPAVVASSVRQFNCTRLVVTGGEPLLQQRQLTTLLGELKKARFTIEVETNGTLLPDESLVHLVDQWNVSPKLAGSRNELERREVPEVYAFFRDAKSAYFKFVVQDSADLAEADSLVQKYDIGPERVILMPEAGDVRTLMTNSQPLVEACKSRGYRFSTRLHVLLWSNERGR